MLIFTILKCWLPAILHFHTKHYWQKIKLAPCRSCNITVQKKIAGKVQVSSVESLTFMQAILKLKSC